MYKIKNKKGISETIAIVIFVLLVLVSVTLIWASVKPLIANLSPEFNCAQARIEQPLVINNVCYDSVTGDVELTLARTITDGSEISTLDFTVTLEDGSSFDYYCGEDCESAVILKAGEVRTYFLNIGNGMDIAQISQNIVGINGCSLVSDEIDEFC